MTQIDSRWRFNRGEMVPADSQGAWTLELEPLTDRAHFALRGPQGDLVSLRGRGGLLRIHFVTTEGAGGPGIFALEGGTVVEHPDGSEHPPFVWNERCGVVPDGVIDLYDLVAVRY